MICWKLKSILGNNNGFTLAELLTVAGVMSIMMAVAVPNYVALQPGMRLNGAAREVLGKLMWARAKAVEQNNQWVVTFPTNHTLTLLDDKNGNGAADAGESAQTFDIHTDYSGVTISKTGGDPIFTSRGTTTTGTTTLTITNSSGSRTVTVTATGNVRIS
jgi:type IV fimbrial biogenesis protein FimT